MLVWQRHMVVCWHCMHVAQSFGVAAEAELCFPLVDPNLFRTVVITLRYDCIAAAWGDRRAFYQG